MSWFEYETGRIYYEDEGSGEAVLFLPGFSESINDHRPFREALGGTLRLIAADLPGSGRSEPQPRSYRPRYHEDDAHAIIALAQALKLRSMHLIGFSDGGEVALLMAALRPDLAKSVLAWGAVGQAKDIDESTIAALYNLVDDPVPSFAAWSQKLIAAYGRDNARAMTQSFSRNLRAILDAGGDISRSKASDIGCPVLLIVGEHDTLNPLANAKDYAAAVRAGTAIEVEGAGHDVHASHGDWLIRTTLDWIADVGKRS